MAPHAPIILNIVCFIGGCIQPIIQQHESTKKKKKTFTIKVATYYDFHYEWKPSCELIMFCGDKDEWDTKERTGKFLKNS